MNIAPQVGGKFNSKSWRILEECVREKVLHDKKDYSVVSGVIFPKKGKSCGLGVKYKDRLDSGLVVPCYFYKVLMDRKALRYEAYLFENIEYVESAVETIRANRATITKISSLTGLKFFGGLGRKYQSKDKRCGE